MARIRLREARPEGEATFYTARYPEGYRHDCWPDHVERVAASVNMISRYGRQIRTAADLSCGDGAILKGVAGGVPNLRQVYLGDLNGVPEDSLDGFRQIRRAIGVTAFPSGILPFALEQLPEPVDLLVLSETLEHVDDPEALLSAATGHARYLFLSTPVGETADVGNTEHYWGWDQADIHDLLLQTGWSPMELELLRPVSTMHLENAYTYQLWMAVRA